MSLQDIELPITMDSNADDIRFQRGVAERDKLLCVLVGTLCDNVSGLQRVLDSMNNLLQDNLVFSSKLMYKLIVAATSGSKDDIPVRRRLLANALVCAQVLVRRFPANPGVTFLLKKLLAKTTKDFNPYAAQILEHLFDDFVRMLGPKCFLRLLKALRKLLQSEGWQDRRSAYFLMTKIQLMCKIDEENGEALLNSLQCSEEQWSVFLAIVADLEKQPQLVESTLGSQLPQLQLLSSDLGERWLAWLRALCLRLLQVGDDVRIHGNLTLRKVLDYFLAHLSVGLLYRLGLLPEFLMATNRSQWFDPEDDNCLKEQQLEQFVARGSVDLLLQALVTIQWKSVPLFHWLDSLKIDQVEGVPKEMFIKLCLSVRGLNSRYLRKRAQEQVRLLFNATLYTFSLRDYIFSIESLFNRSDEWYAYERLIGKINKCTDFETHADCFTRTFYEIFSYRRDWNGLQAKVLNILISKWRTLPKPQHGFWRLVLFDSNGHVFINFYSDIYNVDPTMLQKGASLEKMQVHLIDKLDCRSIEERSFLKARCVDLFTKSLESWSQMEELNVNPLELLDQGTEATSDYLGNLLGAHKKPLQDTNVLRAIIARSSNHNNCGSVLEYAHNYSTQTEVDSCLANLMHYQKLHFWSSIKLSTSLMLKLLIDGKPTTGEERIEAACAHNHLWVTEYNDKVRIEVRWDVKYSKENRSIIFKQLLKMNEELSIKHPHYAENSDVHRQKMRIASALIQLLKYPCNPIPKAGLMLPNDQLGINFMHEFILGNCVKNIDWVLETLPRLQPRKQESYLSVAHIFIVKHLKKLKDDKLTEMLTSLIPFTKGPIYETRILAQLILHNIAVKCEENSIHNSFAVTLKHSVEALLGDKLRDLQNEPRLMLPEVHLDNIRNISYGILYMANAPFDELGYNFTDEGVDCIVILNDKYENARQAFKARKLLSEGISLAADVKGRHPSAKQELILVASLVDKETNVPELMRTCKKFGVKSLVLDEQSHSEELNSADLSIAKVKSESLMEFLVAKQDEGYEIVGSYASFGNTNLAYFKFPRRCILVLGLEKLVITAIVTGVIDHVVNIPQIDPSDSSLGATLLLWEFFKQRCT